MITGKTSTGFEFEIPEKNLNNYELMEALAEEEENPLAVVKIVNLLLGKSQAKRLKDHVRDKDNIVDSEQLTEELKEIFEQQQVKN
ncbi:hypothetical protein [Streptococcus thoraltensis]